MTVHPFVLLVIIGCALVTLVPRVAPFLIVRKLRLPQAVMTWLSFIPVCILTALVIGSVLTKNSAQRPKVDSETFLVLMPTILIALWTKSLLITVIFGVAAMAALRAFL
ncbi:AzlD domain-containing protein [Bacillus xiapuensis]|uniref:AzlD domain-containing protein n=1 Tax=Bacillus xiapuensis TaxID=2014075 RepID=UPI000C23528A|nr:AzlD domain-containing protein [Bacillus xiapuensis]